MMEKYYCLVEKCLVDPVFGIGNANVHSNQIEFKSVFRQNKIYDMVWYIFSTPVCTMLRCVFQLHVLFIIFIQSVKRV